MQKNKLDKDPDAIAEFLANYVYKTRTLGGSFLWPKSLCSTYNKSRGIRNYIEDRVDLTLLEIKHIYEIRKWENCCHMAEIFFFKAVRTMTLKHGLAFLKALKIM